MSVSASGVVSKTDPVSIGEINELINGNTGDLGTLCVHENVNAYSRYKPVRKTQLGTMTDADFKSVNWGYYFPIKCTLSDCICIALDKAPKGTYYAIENAAEVDYSTPTADAENMGCKWYYLRPKGGENSPYRLGDFRGYAHNAAFKVADFETVSSVIDTTKATSWTLYSQNPAWAVDLMDLIGGLNTTDKYVCWGVAVLKSSAAYGTHYGMNTIGTIDQRYVHYKVSAAAAAGATAYPPINFTAAELSQMFWGGAVDTYRVVPFLTIASNAGASAIESVAGSKVWLDNCVPLPVSSNLDAASKPLGYCTVEIIAISPDQDPDKPEYWGMNIGGAVMSSRKIMFTFGYNSNLAGKTVTWQFLSVNGTTEKYLTGGSYTLPAGSTVWNASISITPPEESDTTTFKVRVSYGTASVECEVEY